LLANEPFEKFTPKTLTDFTALEQEIQRVKKQGFALDDEEFLPGLVCLAVLVPRPGAASNLCIAVQAPVMRVSLDKALQWLPNLQNAAAALSQIDANS
jgi:IclR family transcriptional regulator, acetate operon repressor